tara:strand:+ start:102 stop:305 length:204 start_codon:yes stop_codon:yes gene_type:complete
MSKKNKNAGGNAHNKIASIAIILLGLLFFGASLSVSYYDNFTKAILVVGVILIILGGILFKKSFLNK